MDKRIYAHQTKLIFTELLTTEAGACSELAVTCVSTRREVKEDIHGYIAEEKKKK